jgi:hypothetical protein
MSHECIRFAVTTFISGPARARPSLQCSEPIRWGAILLLEEGQKKIAAFLPGNDKFETLPGSLVPVMVKRSRI